MSTSASPELEEHRASQLPTKMFKGHTDTIWSIAYFKDGKRIVSASHDKTVRIWNIEDYKQEGENLMHDFAVNDMALAPDEQKLLSGGEGVALWDLTGRAVTWKTEGGKGRWFRVAYSPDGHLIAAVQRKKILLLDAETGEQIRDPLHFGEDVSRLAFSPDGTHLAAGSWQTVRVFDVATGEIIVGPFNAHARAVASLVFTPDGQQIITASGDQSIRMWDAKTGHEIGEPMLGNKQDIPVISLRLDGRRLASAAPDRTVRVWDLATRRQVGDPLRAQNDPLFTSIAWSPDGRSVVAGDHAGNIHLWDLDALPPGDPTSLPCKLQAAPHYLSRRPDLGRGRYLHPY